MFEGNQDRVSEAQTQDSEWCIYSHYTVCVHACVCEMDVTNKFCVYRPDKIVNDVFLVTTPCVCVCVCVCVLSK